jgi:hypothetical protein
MPGPIPRRAALTRAELTRALLDAVEAANPKVDGDGPALVLRSPVGRIELKNGE